MITSSVEETHAFAGTCLPTLKTHPIWCLRGDLGAGKTTFIQGLLRHLHPHSTTQVQSPTFVYLNIYDNAPPPVYHFDLYRLHNEHDFMSMEFDDYFFADGICCIEWPERIERILPASAVQLTIEHLDATTRKFHLEIPD